jgi:hypothetical protein
LQFGDGQNAPQSNAGEGHLRYNDSNKQWEVSENGGPWYALSEIGESGWTDDGGVVRLTTVTDRVGIGTAAPTPGSKLQVNGTTILDSAGQDPGIWLRNGVTTWIRTDGAGTPNMYIGDADNQYSIFVQCDQLIWPAKIQAGSWPSGTAPGKLGPETAGFSLGDPGRGMWFFGGDGANGSGGTGGGDGGDAEVFGGAGGDDGVAQPGGTGGAAKLYGGVGGPPGQGGGPGPGGDAEVYGGPGGAGGVAGTVKIGAQTTQEIQLGSAPTGPNVKFLGALDIIADDPAAQLVIGAAAPVGAETLRVVGAARIEGKLTVTGLIDPVGLVLDEQSTVPGGSPGAGKGTLWVKDDSPTSLYFTDSAGTDYDLTDPNVGPWAEASGIVALDTASWTVAIGATSMYAGEKLRVQGSVHVQTNIDFPKNAAHSILVEQEDDNVTGQQLEVKAGQGGNSSTTNARGGGRCWIAGGYGGSSTQPGATGGGGAPMWIQGGDAGAINAVAGTGGTGGLLKAFGGIGGRGLGGGDAGIGGGVDIFGGAGGLASGGGDGNAGGAILISGGPASTPGNYDGGGVTIRGGNRAGTGDYGSINIGTTWTNEINIGEDDASLIGFHGQPATGLSPSYTVTALTIDRSFNANTATLGEIADVLGTVITDLQTKGLLGI